MKYGDFGSGKLSKNTITLTLGQHGTIIFMSPEMKNGLLKDPFKSDLYSLAMTFLLIILKIDEEKISGLNSNNSDKKIKQMLSN